MLATDVDKTLVQVDKVIGYHHVADDVESKVQDGPGGDVDTYIKVDCDLTLTAVRDILCVCVCVCVCRYWIN